MSETAFVKSALDTKAPVTEEPAGGDEPIINGDDNGVQKQEGTQQARQVSDAEAKARTMGWRPQEEYKGNAPWIDAEEFLKRGEMSIPILRSEINKLRSQVEEAQKAGKLYAEMRAAEEAKKYQDRIAELEAKMAVAVEEADGRTFLATKQELEQTQREAAKKLEETNKTPDSPAPAALPPEVLAWQEANPWITTEPEAAAVAMARGQALKAQGKPIAEILKGMEQVTRERFPELFGLAPRTNTAQRGGRHTGTGMRSGGKTFNDLPPDAQATCDMLIRNKMVKSRESYAKNYFETYGE